MTIFNRKLLRINQARIINNFPNYNSISMKLSQELKKISH